MTDSAPTKREVLRLRALSAKELPAHDELTEQQSSEPIDVMKFVEAALDEGLDFASKVIPESFTQRGLKSSPPSIAKVNLLSGRYPKGAEEWFARRSVHKGEDIEGTATYGQFENGLMKNHSQYEMEYTPNIMDAVQILEWNLSALQHPKYTECSMSVWEMYHRIPFPFENRVFNTLVIAAKCRPQEFLVVQLPVDKSSFPPSVLERSHQDPASKKYRSSQSDGTWKLSSALTEGMYVSVEHVTAGPGSNQDKNDSTATVGDNEIMWEMATASNAQGNIPTAMQRMAIPGQILKDVGFFLGWVQRNRRGNSKKPSA